MVASNVLISLRWDTLVRLGSLGSFHTYNWLGLLLLLFEVVQFGTFELHDGTGMVLTDIEDAGTPTTT